MSDSIFGKERRKIERQDERQIAEIAQMASEIGKKHNVQSPLPDFPRIGMVLQMETDVEIIKAFYD